MNKTEVKYIRSLELKKFRNEDNVFVAEGNKLIANMLPAFECKLLIAKPSWVATQGGIPARELLVTEKDDIRKASLLRNPQDVLAIFKRSNRDITEITPGKKLALALDEIQGPGNLGTIIRLADWLSTSHIVCSKDTTDVFSPKTVQATMGTLAHVEVHYTDLGTLLQTQPARAISLHGTFLGKENLYEKTLSRNGILIMGSEGNGIRPTIEASVSEKLYIPNYPGGRNTSESLSVAIATAMVCAEFRRRQENPV